MVCFGGFLISGGFVGFAWLCLFNGFVAGLGFAVLCCVLVVILLVAVFCWGRRLVALVSVCEVFGDSFLLRDLCD